MPDQSLILLLDEVRGKTLRLLDSLNEKDARWAPPGLQNSVLWHAGHAYFLLEWLTMKALGPDQMSRKAGTSSSVGIAVPAPFPRAAGRPWRRSSLISKNNT